MQRRWGHAADVFVNPMLRSQGLDHTLLEAMQCGKPLLATHFSSIIMSVI
jgi:glycosyltransferase involved in cell wall biosynthesis